MKVDELDLMIRENVRHSIKTNINESRKGTFIRGASALGGWATSAASLGIGALATVTTMSLVPVALGIGGVVLSAIAVGQMWKLASKIDNREFRNTIRQLESSIEERDNLIRSISGEPTPQEERQVKTLTRQVRRLGSRLKNIMTNDVRISAALTVSEKKQLEEMVEAADTGTLSFMTSR